MQETASELEKQVNESSFPTKMGVGLVSFYQKVFHPLYDLPSKVGFKKRKVCKFEPSCSEYSKQAIRKYGLYKGGIKGIYRILRCNPFNKGGHDPVI